MSDVDVGCLLSAEALGQLVIFKIKCHRHGSFGRFQLFAVFHEGDVIEQGVVLGVGGLILAVVQCLHVGVVVIVLGILGDEGCLQNGIVRNGFCTGKLRRDLHSVDLGSVFGLCLFFGVLVRFRFGILAASVLICVFCLCRALYLFVLIFLNIRRIRRVYDIVFASVNINVLLCSGLCRTWRRRFGLSCVRTEKRCDRHNERKCNTDNPLSRRVLIHVRLLNLSYLIVNQKNQTTGSLQLYIIYPKNTYT